MNTVADLPHKSATSGASSPGPAQSSEASWKWCLEQRAKAWSPVGSDMELFGYISETAMLDVTPPLTSGGHSMQDKIKREILINASKRPRL